MALRLEPLYKLYLSSCAFILGIAILTQNLHVIALNWVNMNVTYNRKLSFGLIWLISKHLSKSK